MIDEPGLMWGTAALARWNSREGSIPFLFRDLIQRLIRALERGVVDQDVDASELGHRSIDDGLALGCLADVAWHQHAPASRGLNVARRLFGVCVLLFVEVADEDVRAFSRICDSHGPADAAVPSGD